MRLLSYLCGIAVLSSTALRSRRLNGGESEDIAAIVADVLFAILMLVYAHWVANIELTDPTEHPEKQERLFQSRRWNHRFAIAGIPLAVLIAVQGSGNLVWYRDTKPFEVHTSDGKQVVYDRWAGVMDLVGAFSIFIGGLAAIERGRPRRKRDAEA